MNMFQLRDFFEFSGGGKLKLNKRDYSKCGFPAFSAAGQDGLVDRWEHDRPAVVVSSIGARCGKAFLANGKWTSLANTFLIFPDLTKALPDFLWYQLNDEDSWVKSGSAQPFIKPSDIKARRVILPPLDEQRRIVAILNRAAKIERLRAQAAERLQEFIPALFVKMFGDPAENPMGMSVHPQVRLDQVVTAIESGFACSKSNLVMQGMLHLRPFNIGQNGDVDLTQEYRVPSEFVPPSKACLRAGDILFNNTNSADLVGKTAIVHENLAASFSNHVTRIRLDLDRCEPMFIAAYMQRLWLQGYFRNHCTQWVNQAAFGTRFLVRLYIPLPPLPEQRRFAGLAAQTACIAANARTAADTAASLSASLMDRLLEAGA